MAFYLLNFTRGDRSRETYIRGPLIPPARQLAERGMWGITEANSLRSRLAPGDKVLLYVGAPEQAVIGTAKLGSVWHTWTEQEARRYPGKFPAGVVFADAELFPRPVSLRPILGEMSFGESNPRLMFRSGVIRIERTDYDAVSRAAQREGNVSRPVHRVSVPAAGGAPPERPRNSSRRQPAQNLADRLFEAAERLRDYLSEPRGAISEEGTRARLINPVIDALGYTGWDDVEHGSAAASGDFPDYVLRVDRARVAAIEAKKLGQALRSREAAQLIAYAATLGVRWGVVTDGRVWKVYDAPVLNVEPEDRVVFEVDLADYGNREEFEARITRIWRFSPSRRCGLVVRCSVERRRSRFANCSRPAVPGQLRRYSSSSRRPRRFA